MLILYFAHSKIYKDKIVDRNNNCVHETLIKLTAEDICSIHIFTKIRES